MEKREFDVIEFLERLDELTADCETEEEVKEIYIEEIEKLTDEEAEEFYRVMKEIEEDDCECEECAEERVTSKYVPVITEHLEGVGINADEFDKGVDDVSRICGQFSLP